MGEGGLTLQIHGYQSFHYQVGQEALHPVEEKGSAAVQYLLPVGLATRGQNSGGYDHTSGLGVCICNCLLQDLLAKIC